jgi:membrane fusion protein (multidrug efflux system)
MFLRGEAALPARQSLAVPQAAILYQGPNAYVFVIERQTRDNAQVVDVARRTAVRLGLRANGWVEVTSGLRAGARIAGAGAAFLQNGDAVRAIGPQQKQQQRTQAKQRSGDARGR